MVKVSDTNLFTFWTLIPFKISNAFSVNDPDECTPDSIPKVEVEELYLAHARSLFEDNESLTLMTGSGSSEVSSSI